MIPSVAVDAPGSIILLPLAINHMSLKVGPGAEHVTVAHRSDKISRGQPGYLKGCSRSAATQRSVDRTSQGQPGKETSTPKSGSRLNVGQSDIFASRRVGNNNQGLLADVSEMLSSPISGSLNSSFVINQQTSAPNASVIGSTRSVLNRQDFTNRT